MKIFAVFTLFIVGISALPQTKLGANIDFKDQRLVTDAIASAIQDISQQIKDADLDPMHISSFETSYALPVPVLFNAVALVEEFLFTGLSEIVINNLSFSILTYRVTFDISLPLIQASLDASKLDATFFGEQYSASVSGRFAIVNIRVHGNVRVNVGIISGISVRSISINFSIADIQSALTVVVQNWDLSNYINNFLGVTVPKNLNDFSSEINELLEIVITDLINDMF